MFDPDTSNLVAVTYVDQRRKNLATIRYSDWTTRMEMAAVRWVKRAGYFSPQDNLLAMLLNGAVVYKDGEDYHRAS